MRLKMRKPKEDSTTKIVLRSTFYNFLSTFVGRIGGLVFTVVVARALFPELFGIYNIALTIVLAIATFIDLGINSTLIRYVAESLKTRNRKSEAEARSRLAFLLKFKILLSAAASLLLFVLSNVIAVHVFHKPVLAVPLQLGSIYLFALSLQGFFSSIFYALQKINYSVVAETVFQVLRIALVFAFFNIYRNVGSVFVILAISSFVSFIFLYFAVGRNSPFLLKGKKEMPAKEKKRMLGFFGWMTVSSISFVFFANVDDFMLGIFLPAQFAGYYAAITGIIGAVIGFVAFNSFLMPAFTKIEKEGMKRGFKKVFHYASMAAIPAAIGLAFVAVPLMQLIYGNAYVPSDYRFAIAVTSAILGVLVVEESLAFIYSSVFQAKEKPKIPAILIVIATVLNIALNYVFIKIGISMKPEYGLIAVAAATLITRMGNLAALAAIAKRDFNMCMDARSIFKPLAASAVMLGFLFAFSHFVSMNIWTGILMIVLASLVYLAVMLMIKGIKKEDFKLIRMLK